VETSEISEEMGSTSLTTSEILEIPVRGSTSRRGAEYSEVGPCKSRISRSEKILVAGEAEERAVM